MFKDKNQAVKHPADILPKKVGETLPPQSSQMGFGIYHFCECEYFTHDVKSHETDEPNIKKQKQQQHSFGIHTLHLLSFILDSQFSKSKFLFFVLLFFKIQQNLYTHNTYTNYTHIYFGKALFYFFISLLNYCQNWNKMTYNDINNSEKSIYPMI